MYVLVVRTVVDCAIMIVGSYIISFGSGVFCFAKSVIVGGSSVCDMVHSVFG